MATFLKNTHTHIVSAKIAWESSLESVAEEVRYQVIVFGHRSACGWVWLGETHAIIDENNCAHFTGQVKSL